MMKNRFERLPMAVALGFAVLVVAACAIRLRGNESASQSSSSFASKTDAPAAKVAQCRTVTYEQKEALLECRKIWAEQRNEFLSGGGSSSGLDSRAGTAPYASPVLRKDESRLSSGSPSMPSQSE